MHLFSNLSVARKLSLVAGASLLGLAALCAIGYQTLATVRVNGPVYASIVRNKDLVADILPPPEYILESYLVVQQLQDEGDAGKRAELIGRLAQLEKDFESRHDYWGANLDAGELKQSLEVAAYEPAHEFFRIANEQFIPEVKRGDAESRARAQATLNGAMTAAYEKHRAAIDEVVKLANSATESTEKSAASTITSRTWILAIVGLVVAGVIALANWFIGRGIAVPVRQIRDAVAKLAEGDLRTCVTLDQRDELGELAKGFNESAQRLRQVMKDVASSAQQVAGASAEIAASSEQMAAGLNKQEQQTSQVAAAVEEMSSSVVEVAKKSADAANAAESAGKEAGQGRQIVESTIGEMQSISTGVNASAQTVSELGRKSEEIGRIIGVINDIADQTNLLALNAAIEAARAGEHGRGFAVVADEVRKLAERTTKATEEVSRSIREIQGETTSAVDNIKAGTDRVGRGVQLANEAGEALKRIVAGSSNLHGMVQSIAAAAEEQSAASEQIARSVEAISAVSKESTQGATQAAQAAAVLNQQAESLQRLVTRFKV